MKPSLFMEQGQSRYSKSGILLFLFCLIYVLLLSGSLQARMWMSKDGATLDAEYSGKDGYSVLLQAPNGSKTTIHFGNLSRQDQQYLLPSSRTWRSTDGNELEAQLVSQDAFQVILEDYSGRRYKIGIARLSAHDRSFLGDENRETGTAGSNWDTLSHAQNSSQPQSPHSPPPQAQAEQSGSGVAIHDDDTSRPLIDKNPIDGEGLGDVIFIVVLVCVLGYAFRDSPSVILVIGVVVALWDERFSGGFDKNSYQLLLAELAAFILIYGGILALLALIISSAKKDVRGLWYPIFAWLFLIAGTFDFMTNGFNRKVLEPQLDAAIEEYMDSR
jgi:hypothetical protein